MFLQNSSIKLFLILLASVLLSNKMSAQYWISTYCGQQVMGFADGQGTNANFWNPLGICCDTLDNLFVVDGGNNAIRKISPSGYVTTFAGGNGQGYVDGPGSTAKFNLPFDICIDASQNLYVTDLYNHKIRKIDQNGNVSTLAGDVAGYADGYGTNARFERPRGICIDKHNVIFVTDFMNSMIRKIDTTGYVSTIAGNGMWGLADGPALSAMFHGPDGIAVDSIGNIYVSETWNHCIRLLDTSGNVTLVAGSNLGWQWPSYYQDGQGTQAQFHRPGGLMIDDNGHLLIVEYGNSAIRSMSPTYYVSTLAGIPYNPVFANGPQNVATFNEPSKICKTSDGSYYITDQGNNMIRKMVLTPTGNVQNSLANGLQIFPNPCKSYVYIQVQKMANYKLIDILGKTIQKGEVKQGGNQINLDGIVKGLYIIQFETQSEMVSRTIFIDP